MGSLSIWHWLIVLSIVIVVFGTKKLRTAGGDLGEAMKNFKNAMNDGEFIAKENVLQSKVANSMQAQNTESAERSSSGDCTRR